MYTTKCVQAALIRWAINTAVVADRDSTSTPPAVSEAACNVSHVHSALVQMSYLLHMYNRLTMTKANKRT